MTRDSSWFSRWVSRLIVCFHDESQDPSCVLTIVLETRRVFLRWVLRLIVCFYDGSRDSSCALTMGLEMSFTMLIPATRPTTSLANFWTDQKFRERPKTSFVPAKSFQDDVKTAATSVTTEATSLKTPSTTLYKVSNIFSHKCRKAKLVTVNMGIMGTMLLNIFGYFLQFESSKINHCHIWKKKSAVTILMNIV